ncbi:MAG: hypothetical protein U5K69_14285 [Balneolaceae bacterium]|nr:hypothetical protein [Balneolaceae bacterium]
MSAERPRIKSTLKILLPMTFPKAILACPVRAEFILTASSGELVPNATTVKPITSGDMPIPAAIRDAPRTKISAPMIKKTNPERKRKMVI